MKYCKFSRRMFLQGAGKTMLAIPFMGSVLSDKALAQATTNFPIYVQMGMTYGNTRAQTYPLANTVALNDMGSYARSQSLAEIIAAEGQTCGMFDASWNSFAKYMNIFTNVTLYRTAHHHHAWGNFSCTTHAKDGPSGLPAAYSVDDRVLRAWVAKGYAPSIPVIRTSIDNSHGQYNPYSWGANGGGRHYEIKTISELENVILDAAGGGNKTSSSANDPKLKIVDLVIEDYRRLKNSSKISAVDRMRFEQAMDLWNEISNKRKAMLDTNTDPGSCVTPAQRTPTSPSQKYLYATDLMLAALQCGLTNVVTQNMFALNDDHLDPAVSARVEYHDGSHFAEGGTPRSVRQDDWKDFEKVMTWMSNDLVPRGFRWRFQFVKNWMQKLESVQDSNGVPLMNKSLIFVTSEYATGHHTHFGHTAWTFGTAGGRMQAGNHINGGAAPYQKVHTTVMQALGLNTQEIEAPEGGPGFGDYRNGWSDPHADLILWKFLADNRQDLLIRNNFDRFNFFNSATERRRPFPILT